MPPEQILGRGGDERSDVWAIGVVLYEMLAGLRPFRGDHDVAVIHTTTDDVPRPLREARPDIPAEFEPIVARALQKDPTARYTSAREFLRDIEMVRADRAGHTRT